MLDRVFHFIISLKRFYKKSKYIHILSKQLVFFISAITLTLLFFHCHCINNKTQIYFSFKIKVPLNNISNI